MIKRCEYIAESTKYNNDVDKITDKIDWRQKYKNAFNTGYITRKRRPLTKREIEAFQIMKKGDCTEIKKITENKDPKYLFGFYDNHDYTPIDWLVCKEHKEALKDVYDSIENSYPEKPFLAAALVRLMLSKLIRIQQLCYFKAEHYYTMLLNLANME